MFVLFCIALSGNSEVDAELRMMNSNELRNLLNRALKKMQYHSHLLIGKLNTKALARWKCIGKSPPYIDWNDNDIFVARVNNKPYEFYYLMMFTHLFYF